MAMPEDKPETTTTETPAHPTASATAPATPATKAAAAAANAKSTTAAKQALAPATKVDEHIELVEAPKGFALEKRSHAHGNRAEKAAISGPPRKVEVTHGRVLCGEITRDKDTRSRETEQVAYGPQADRLGRMSAGDLLTLPAEDAHNLVTAGVARYADLPAQV